MPLYNLKTGKMERVPPEKFLSSKVVLPDQVDWKDGKPKPVSAKVQLSSQNNDMREGNFKDAEYVMRHPSQLFSVTSNLIPFLGPFLHFIYLIDLLNLISIAEFVFKVENGLGWILAV